MGAQLAANADATTPSLSSMVTFKPTTGAEPSVDSLAPIKAPAASKPISGRETANSPRIEQPRDSFDGFEFSYLGDFIASKNAYRAANMAQIRSSVLPVIAREQAAQTYPTIALQEWEGRVVRIGNEDFTASLIDVTSKDSDELEEVDLPVSDVSEDDKSLFREGAIFRWVIGYRQIGGTKERFSRIVFRRLPAWQKADIEAIKQNAARRASQINWE